VQADARTVRFNVGVGLWKDDSGTGHSVTDFLDRFVARTQRRAPFIARRRR
jgi:hypothetical protein